jgi:hypothetical protein
MDPGHPVSALSSNSVIAIQAARLWLVESPEFT